MNHKVYQEQMDKIHVDENKKQELKHRLEKFENPRVFERKRYYTIAIVMLTFALVIVGSVGLQMHQERRKVAHFFEKDVATASDIDANQDLAFPTVENKENFLEMLKELDSKNAKMLRENGGYDTIIADTAEKSEITDESGSSSTNSIQSEDSYSKTNVQVEGIDEADIIKVDEHYIYYLQNAFNQIVILDREKQEVMHEIDYEQKENTTFFPREMFVASGKLFVIGTEYEYETVAENTSEKYQYDTISKFYTSVLVYEAEKNFEQAREIKIEGSYLDARLMNGNVYLISQKGMNYALYRNKAIEEIQDTELAPCFMDSAVGENKMYQPLDHIYYFENTTDSSILNIASFAIDKNEKVFVESFFGAGNHIYMSYNGIYIAQMKYEENKNKTEIYKVKITGTDLQLVAKGEVIGNLNNQFSMDEYEGNLRVATTAYISGEETTNQLYILNEKLECIGKIEDMAKGEKIYSVRFFGKIGYVVTFEEVDPLFVIDLSDDQNPQVKGELKIPGYSSYLHVYDENHVLGLGNDTKMNANGSISTDGMKMTMFDVSDLENPKEKFSVSIGKDSYSSALYDHKAIMFSKEKDLIAYPVGLKENGKWVYGAMIYHINIEKNAFEKLGFIEGKNTERIIYIGDEFYVFDREKIQILDMYSLEIKKKIDITDEM